MSTDVAEQCQDLIREGKPVREAISTRDDIMTNLIASVDPSMSFKIMEYVRKGKAAKGGLNTMLEAMRAAKVPEWYIDPVIRSVSFSKAHAVAYVMITYRIAYCKVHYPVNSMRHTAVRAPDFL